MIPLVTRQSYMALNVKDLDACVRDAQEVTGLRLVDKTANVAMLTASTRHAELVLHKASVNAARCVGLEACSSAAVDEAIQRLRTEGVQILSEKPSLPCIDR